VTNDEIAAFHWNGDKDDRSTSMTLTPCKHLDYEGDYTHCTLRNCSPHFPLVRYWERNAIWTDNGPGEKPNPRDVQFCKLRGRINAIFDCYDGSLSCYEPEEPRK
jgi:hypothetical protein